MNKKIVFFTEANFNGKVPLEATGRTDMNWIYANDAYHMSINNIESDMGFDVGIYIVPKKNPKLDLDFLISISKLCKKIGIMQEAAHDTYQEHDVDTQIMYLNALSCMDFVLCHNEIDEKYFKGFLSKPVFRHPTLMLTDTIDKSLLCDPLQRNGTMLGGTLCKWYNGMDSYLIACNLDGKIYAPAMGRMTDYENYIEDIKYISYSSWNKWMVNLSRVKYAVHMMRTAAAGSFPLNCAYLKIPCVGWNTSDTQRTLFPKLSFEVGDMEGAKKMVKHLATNEQFYQHVTEYAFKIYETNYSIDNYKNQMEMIYEKLLCE